MSVRVTQTMLNSNMLRNLNNSMRNMDKFQEQLSSGKKVSKPSDDPVVAARGMYYRSSLMENDQYLRNTSEAQSWMDMTDATMDEMGNVLHRIKELLVYSGDGALSDADLKAMGSEITQLRDHLGTLANQQINGKYIFAGTEVLTPPFDENVSTPNGTGDFTNTNSSELQLEVSQNVFVSINVNAQRIFNYPNNAGNMFKVLDNVLLKLNNGESASQYLSDVESQMNNLLAERATLGAKVNRIDLIKERLETADVNITGLMSKNEDADLSEVITDLKMQENIHSAALGAGARIIQPTLLDFLR